MKPNELKRYLDMHDELGQVSQLTQRQQLALTNLRILASSANTGLDLTKPIETLTQPLCSTKPWESLTPFEKLVGVLNNQHDPVPFLYPARPWLQQLIQTVQSQLGGEFHLTYLQDGIELRVNGPLTMKYSVYMALISSGMIEKSFIDTHHIHEELVLNVDEAALNSVMQRAKTLRFIQHYLQQLGFNVDTGSKTCEQSLSQNTAFANQDDAELKKSYAMSLAFAQELQKCHEAPLVFPLTLKITTHDDALMHRLESFYRHPLVNLFSRDGKPKTFVVETRASGLLHESILNMNQLDSLRDFIDRLEYFSAYYNKPALTLTEDEMTQATLAIYQQINQDKESLVTPGQSFEVEQYGQRQSTGILSSLYSAISPFNLKSFEESIEGICKNKLIPGTQIFLKDSAFNARFNQIQSEIFQSESYLPWPSFKESYHPVLNCNTPRSPLPISCYARAIAESSVTGHRSIINQSPSEHALGIQWLNQTIDRRTYGSAANQQYYDFYTENNAYYLLDSLVSAIKACLDHPNCQDSNVRDMLTLIGVPPRSMEQLQSTLGAERHFNRFQIKLFLLPLVLNGLCQQHVLEDVASLAQSQNPWVKIPSPNPSYATTPAQWTIGMRDWKNMEIQGISWHVGGPASTSSERKQQETVDRNTLFAGGARADQTRQTTAQNSTVSFGSGG